MLSFAAPVLDGICTFTTEIPRTIYGKSGVSRTSASETPGHVTVLPDGNPTWVAGGAIPQPLKFRGGLIFSRFAAAHSRNRFARLRTSLPHPLLLHPRFDPAPSRPSLLACCRIRPDAHCIT